MALTRHINDRQITGRFLFNNTRYYNKILRRGTQMENTKQRLEFRANVTWSKRVKWRQYSLAQKALPAVWNHIEKNSDYNALRHTGWRVSTQMTLQYAYTVSPVNHCPRLPRVWLTWGARTHKRRYVLCIFIYSCATEEIIGRRFWVWQTYRTRSADMTL